MISKTNESKEIWNEIKIISSHVFKKWYLKVNVSNEKHESKIKTN